jgi:hypothetical protein
VINLGLHLDQRLQGSQRQGVGRQLTELQIMMVIATDGQVIQLMTKRTPVSSGAGSRSAAIIVRRAGS